MTQLPVPPDGMRPGHLGIIAVGRIILGDIAATAVDLALRGVLRIESADGGASTFGQRPEWRAPVRRTDRDSDAGISAAPGKRTLEEDIMSRDVGAMLWVSGW